jgi:hypothetical protein
MDLLRSVPLSDLANGSSGQAATEIEVAALP